LTFEDGESMATYETEATIYNVSQQEGQSPVTEEAQPLPVSWLVVIGILAVIGTVNNLLILTAFTTTNRLSSKPRNVFVVNLALADLMMTSYFIPVGLATSQFLESPFGQTMCSVNAFFILTSCGVSTQSLMLIALERYFHICKTKYYLKVFRPWLVGVYICIIWVYAAFWACHGWTGWTRYRYGATVYVCLVDGPYSLSYDVCLVLFGMFLPMAVLSFAYTSIFRKVQESNARLAKHRETYGLAPASQEILAKTERTIRKEFRFVMTLFIIVICFIVLWLPAAIVLPMSSLWLDMPSKFFTVAVWLAFSNSCINGLIYGLLNKNFRKGYFHVVKKLCCWDKDNGRLDCTNCCRDDAANMHERISEGRAHSTDMIVAEQGQTPRRAELGQTPRQYSKNTNMSNKVIPITIITPRRATSISPDEQDNSENRFQDSETPVEKFIADDDDICHCTRDECDNAHQLSRARCMLGEPDLIDGLTLEHQVCTCPDLTHGHVSNSSIQVQQCTIKSSGLGPDGSVALALNAGESNNDHELSINLAGAVLPDPDEVTEDSIEDFQADTDLEDDELCCSGYGLIDSPLPPDLDNISTYTETDYRNRLVNTPSFSISDHSSTKLVDPHAKSYHSTDLCIDQSTISSYQGSIPCSSYIGDLDSLNDSSYQHIVSDICDRSPSTNSTRLPLDLVLPNSSGTRRPSVTNSESGVMLYSTNDRECTSLSINRRQSSPGLFDMVNVTGENRDVGSADSRFSWRYVTKL